MCHCYLHKSEEVAHEVQRNIQQTVINDYRAKHPGDTPTTISEIPAILNASQFNLRLEIFPKFLFQIRKKCKMTQEEGKTGFEAKIGASSRIRTEDRRFTKP